MSLDVYEIHKSQKMSVPESAMSSWRDRTPFRTTTTIDKELKKYVGPATFSILI
jgi:hypothetical protein